MGQARKRGTFEERRAKALARKQATRNRELLRAPKPGSGKASALAAMLALVQPLK